ncbi:MAG TPA: DUF2252 family protein [Candidatus Binataceae bacterium]|nr:DUF2252 family protein [Candidatus Binataceae bacterium]
MDATPKPDVRLVEPTAQKTKRDESPQPFFPLPTINIAPPRSARAVGLLLAADDDPLFLQIKAARFCGRCLARAHAQSGDAATISGYMGSRGIFDNAIGEFAV